MKMSIAQALKEKNRLAGEIAFMWQLFQNENICLVNYNRKVDVKQTLQTIEHYTAKLVELKTKISVANQGTHLCNMQKLESAKKKIKKLSETNSSEDGEEMFNRTIERTAIFKAETLNTMMRQLRREEDELQDRMDAHNAKVQIDFESPLK